MDIEDADSLIDYLRRSGRIGPDETPRVRALPGGVSNRTVLVARRGDAAGAWVIKQALAKLRVDVDWYSDPARVHREALGLRWLEQLTPTGSVPQFVFEDHEHHLLAMQAIPQPHENWKTQLLAGRLDPEHVQQFATMLASIHYGSFDRREKLRPLFEDRTFFESLRLEPYYAYAATQVPAAADFLQRLLADTRSRQLTLVHGDYSPKNVLVHEHRLVLLDHEVIHWGDPAFDLGFSLTHLLSKAHHLPASRAAFADAARNYWTCYLARIGDGVWQEKLEPHAVRHTLGCLLARVAGRSPLEYLDQKEQAAQQQIVLAMLKEQPRTVDDLIDEFTERLTVSRKV